MQASFLTYRSALALNNMAVTLLQKGCFGTALKTMTDSLVLMKMAFRDSRDVRVTNSTYAHKIYQAAARRCTTQRTGGSSAMMEIQALDDGDFASLHLAAGYGPSLSIAFPITITESPAPHNGMEDGAEALDVGRQLGIILYNHGLASLLVALDESTASTEVGTLDSKSVKASIQIQKLQAASIKSLIMSDRTFARLLEPVADEYDGTPRSSSMAEPSLLLLSALVLNCQSLVFQEQNLLDQAKEAQQLANLLCSDVDQDCFSSVLLRQESAPAA